LVARVQYQKHAVASVWMVSERLALIIPSIAHAMCRTFFGRLDDTFVLQLGFSHCLDLGLFDLCFEVSQKHCLASVATATATVADKGWLLGWGRGWHGPLPSTAATAHIIGSVAISIGVRVKGVAVGSPSWTKVSRGQAPLHINVHTAAIVIPILPIVHCVSQALWFLGHIGLLGGLDGGRGRCASCDSRHGGWLLLHVNRNTVDVVRRKNDRTQRVESC